MLSYLNVLVILAVVMISLLKAEKREDGNALSVEQGNCIKGIAAVFLVFVHIKNELANPGSYTVLSSAGYLFVAIFFFYSGYGSTRKAILDKTYIPQKMVLKVLYLFKMIVITEVVYLLVNILFLEKKYDLMSTIKAIFGINLLNGAMWYIVALLIIYLATTVFASFVKNPGGGYTAIAVLAVGTYILISAFRGRAPHEIQSCIAYVFGAYCAEKMDRKSNEKMHNYLLLFGLFCVSFIAPYVFRHFWIDSSLIRIIFGSLSSVFFVMLLIFVLEKVKIENKVLVQIGKVSTEIYLSHQLVINIFAFIFPRWFQAQTSVLLSLVIIFTVLVISFGIKQITIFIQQRRKEYEGKAC